MSAVTAQDAAISDFRAAHSEALNSAAHPLHAQRLGELSSLYEAKHAAPSELVAPSGSAAEFRNKHDASLNDKAHPEHALRVAELTKATERDTPQDAPDGFIEPASSTAAYDEAIAKARQSVPYGSNLVPDAVAEEGFRNAMLDAQASPSEAGILLGRYMEAQRYGFTPPTPESCRATIEMAYPGKADEVIHAVRQLVTAAPTDLVDRLEASGLSNDWFVFSALANIAKRKGLCAATGLPMPTRYVPPTILTQCCEPWIAQG